MKKENIENKTSFETWAESCPIVGVVRKTREYDRFTIHDENRVINKNHVKKLAASIKTDGLISPIIVNENSVIIEGQHREEACEEIDADVYFIVKPGLNMDMVAKLNRLQKPWGTADYVHNGIRKQIKGFKEIEDLHTEFNISYRTVTYALTRNSDGNQIQVHADSGQPFNFNQSDITRARSELNFVRNNKSNLESIGIGDAARVALIFAYATVPDKKRLQSILNKRARDIGADARRAGRGNVESCLLAITEIYNERLSTGRIESLVDAYRRSLSDATKTMLHGKRKKGLIE